MASGNTAAILATAQLALKRAEKIAKAQKEYTGEITELYNQLKGQKGREAAEGYSLVRTGPGRYRTPAGGKERGTASNLYLAATRNDHATIQTRSGSHDAQACSKRVLELTGVDTQSEAFQDLICAAYKLYLHEDISEKRLSEWEQIRNDISEALEAAKPLQADFFSRLFIDSQTKIAASSALNTLQRMDLKTIADNFEDLYEWVERRPQLYSPYERFMSDDDDRNAILACIERVAGRISLDGADPHPFSSRDAQKVLDQLQSLSGVPAAISNAIDTMGQTISSAIDSLREEFVRGRLSSMPIENQDEAKTGAQIKKLCETGIETLEDLYTRASSAGTESLPGIGPKTLPAVNAFLEALIAKLQQEWRINLSDDGHTESTSKVIRAIQARFELEGLRRDAEQALSNLKQPDSQAKDDLRLATDPIDWLLAGKRCIKIAANGMDAVQKTLDSDEGKLLLSLSSGAKINRLGTSLVTGSKAWKAFDANPARFTEVIESLAPGAATPIEQQATAEPASASAPTKTSDKNKRAKKSSKKAPVAKQGGAACPSWCSANVPDTLAAGEGLVPFYPPLEYIDSSAVLAKPIAADDAPRAQGTHFSCAIPDGWITVANQGRTEFTLVPSEPSPNGLEANISISYDPQIDSGNDAELLRFAERGTSSFIWGVRYIQECMHPHECIEMHEAAGSNCRCTVKQMATGDDCLVYRIFPYSLTGADFLSVRLGKPGTYTPEEARAFVDGIARTIEIKEPTVLQRLKGLDERFLEAQSLSEANYSGMSLLLTDLWTYFVNTYEDGKDYCRTIKPNATEKEREAAGVCACTQYLDTCVPHVEHCTDLVRQWLEDHTARNIDILIAWDIIETMERLVLTPERFESPLIREELADLLKPTPMQLALLEKLESLKAMVEKLDIEDSGDEEPATHDESDGEQADTDNAAAPSSDLWQEAQMDFPTFMLTLLSSSRFFFEGNDISWDGTSHSIGHIEINGLKLGAILAHIKEFDAGFDSVDEVTQYFVAFMNALPAHRSTNWPCRSPSLRRSTSALVASPSQSGARSPHVLKRRPRKILNPWLPSSCRSSCAAPTRERRTKRNAQSKSRRA